MSKISFECKEESVDLFVDILTKLQESTKDLKIRIGGSEYNFYKDVDNDICDLAVNEIYWDDEVTSSDQIFYHVARNNAIEDFIEDESVPVQVSDIDPDTDANTDTDEQDEVACLECGIYGDMDSQGLCPNCSDGEDKEEEDEDVLPYSDANEVRNELAEFVRMNRIFTAFDITKRVRKRGVRCRHDQVKEIVHRMFEAGCITGYTRSLADIGTGTQPWLYCPFTRDPSEYNNGGN
jgi:hypothetical protein